jgi:raffinose/stachyose/melibiose transport system substrate-binding protein
MQGETGGWTLITRHRAKWLVIVSLLALAVLSSLLVSSATATPTKRHANGVTLRIVYPTANAIPIKLLVDNFKRAYPDINVNLELYPSNVLAALYQTQFRAGNGPDLLYLDAGYGTPISVLNYVDQGYIQDLSKRPFAKRIPPQMTVGRMTGGKLWSYAFGVGAHGMYANVDLMRQLGIARPPQTYSAMLADCRKISAAGKIPIAWSPGDAGLGQILALSMVASTVFARDPNWNAKRIRGEVKFATSRWVRLFEQIVEMKNAKCFSPGAVGTTGDTATAQMAHGDAVMTGTLTNLIFLVKTINPSIHLEFFGFPGEKAGETRTTLAFTNPIAMNGTLTGAQKDAAFKFIDFVTRPDQTAAYDKAAGLLPASVLQNFKIPPDQPIKELGALVQLLHKKNPLHPYHRWPNPQVDFVLNAGVAGLMTGQTTPQKLAADMDAAFDKGHG